MRSRPARFRVKIGSYLWLAALVAPAACRRTTNAEQVVKTTAQALVDEPETGSAGAVYQRYRFRHQIVASMKSDLSNLVKAQETYFADSSKYTTTTTCVKPTVPGTAAWCASTGNSLDGIRITPHGWWTTITNLNTAVHCAIAVGPDTSFGAPSGTPVCFGVSTPPNSYPKSPL